MFKSNNTFQKETIQMGDLSLGHIVSAERKTFFEIAPVIFSSELDMGEVIHRRHSHEFYSIFWCLESGGEHEVDFAVYPVEEGMMFFIAPNEFHCCQTNVKQKGITIAFAKDFILSDCKFYNYLRYAIFHQHKRKPFCKIPKNVWPIFLRITEEMQEEYVHYKENFAYHESQQLLLERFLLLTQRYGEWDRAIMANSPDQKYDLFREFIEMVREYVCSNTDAHKIEFYIDKLSCSEKTLRVCTNKYANASPKNIIDEQIMHEAKKILVYSALSGREIARCLSFKDESNFIKFFKSHSGMTPLEFRQQVNK